MSLATAVKKLTSKQKSSIDRTDPVIVDFETRLKAAITSLCTERGLCGDAQRIPAQEFGWRDYGRRDYYNYEVPVTGTVRIRLTAYNQAEADEQMRGRIAQYKALTPEELSRTMADNYTVRSVSAIDLDAINPPVPPAPEPVDPATTAEHEGLALFKAWVRQFAEDEVRVNGRISVENVNWVLEKVGVEPIDGPGYFTFTVPVTNGIVVEYEVHGNNAEHAREKAAGYIKADQEAGKVQNGRVKATSLALPTELDTAEVAMRRHG